MKKHDLDDPQLSDIKHWAENSDAIPTSEQYREALNELRRRTNGESTAFMAVAPTIPNYQLVELVGQGGMGCVWLAEQTCPIQRTVAIKVIRPGLEQHVRRLKNERQTLARISHPNIAQIFEAGETACGRPYFAMEFIQGEDLITYVERNECDLKTRLELFLIVCDAIAFSHSKRIIHRDIKPTNILVSHQASPLEKTTTLNAQLKIIDFGLALDEMDSVRDELRENTLENTVLGSLFWMSPEQARRAEDSTQSIDRRTDVYSLGAVLYQLLTSTPPLAARYYESSSVFELIQAIQRDVPEKPSQRLERRLAGLHPPFRNGGGLPAALAIRELDWVVLKAIEKNPNRRYQRVADFADDVQRFLDHRPTSARPPSLVYQTRKWLERNRVAAIWAGSVSAIVLVLSAVIVSASIRAETANRRSTQASRQVEQKENEAVLLREDIAQLDSLFDESLSRISPWGHGYTASKKDSDYLYDLAERLKTTDLSNQRRLGLACKIATISIGYDDTVFAHEYLAQTLASSDLDKDGLEYFKANCILGECLVHSGNKSEGLELIENSIARVWNSINISKNEVFEQQSRLACLYLQHGQLEKGLRYAEELLGPDFEMNEQIDRFKFNLLCVLIKGNSEIGKKEKAFRYCELASKYSVDDTPEDAVKIIYGANLIDVYKGALHFEEAHNLAGEMLELARNRFGESHSLSIDLQKAKWVSGYFSGIKTPSIDGLKETLELSKTTLGDTDRLTLNITSDLANLLCHESRFDEAVELLESTSQARIAAFGPTHRESIVATTNYGIALAGLGRTDDAGSIIRAIYDECMSADVTYGYQLLEPVRILATLYWGGGKQAEAFSILRQFSAKCKACHNGVNQAAILDSERFLARLALNVGNVQHCESLCLKVLEMPEVESTSYFGSTCLVLAELKISQNELEAARNWIDKVLSQPMADIGDPTVIHHAKVLLAEVQLNQNEINSAVNILTDVLQKKPISPIYQFYGHSLYAECLMRSGKLELAEQHLLSSFKTLNSISQALESNWWYLPRVTRRLEKLYEKMEKPEKQKHWQAETLRIENQISRFVTRYRGLAEEDFQDSADDPRP